MKKITDFIVNKRYIILITFIILAIICAFISQKVNINYDINKYLPQNSPTRIGLNIMEKEFKETSSFNLMFKGLKEDEKQEIFNYLNGLDEIYSIDYDETEDYNKDDYTLYVITVDSDKDSEVSSNIYNTVKEKYKDYEIYTGGEIADRNTPVLAEWIIVLAVGCALIILIIMCESFVEPFLFLFAILLAVLYNKGTNIIFPSISYISASISAILQLALSMDYSIMLMNRYNQERKETDDKVTAMKKALYNAFKSISSSSITTIVGLIVLVFMSFTIGKDLGLILAKGVLFSLISIFFVLPGLILMFDKWIEKTKKKRLNLSLNTLGKISYKLRYISIPVFLIIFIGSFILKGNLEILYTNSESDETKKIFNGINQMALIYKNEDEEKVANIISDIENEDNVKEVLAYSNTINDKLKYNELKDKSSDLGSEIDIEDYLIKLLYYEYYSKDTSNKMTFGEFVDFIKSNVYNNKDLEDQINEAKRKDVDRLENFVHESSINKKRTASEISQIMEIDKSKVEDLLIYYRAKNNDVKISMSDFVKFMNNDVLTNNKYSAKVDSKSREKLNKLSKYISKTTIKKEMTSSEMAKLFEIDESQMNDLYKYYVSINDINLKLTISEFSNFVLKDVINDANYEGLFNEETVSNIKMLATFSNTDITLKEMNSEEIAKLFGMDKNVVSKLLYFKYINVNDENMIEPSNWSTTPYEFVNLILENSSNEAIKASFDEATLGKLKLLSNIMNSGIEKREYSYSEISEVIGINKEYTKNIYTLYVIKKQETKMTPLKFISFILNHKNDEILSGKFSDSQISELQLIKKIMEDVLNNKKYSETEISNLLGIDKEKAELLYGLYDSKYVNKNLKLSLKEFVNFILNDVITNKEYSSNFNNEKIQKIKTINNIMKSSINKQKYNASEIFGILNILSNNVDESTIELLYSYYGSQNEYNENWQLSIEEFVKYLNDDILQDSRFDDFIDNEKREKIIDAKEKINNAKDLLVAKEHSRVIINTKFEPEADDTFEFIQRIKDLFEENNIEGYIIGNSPMAYEMNGTFGSEMDFITVLTMISIFVVVAITFKSLLVPIILVFIIQCAVYITMVILHVTGDKVYFIALLIVQSILMGATIDYAILYTSYYLEHRKTMTVKEAVINSYNKSIHTILNSSSILIIVTLIVANYASAIAAKICKTISEGTLCSTILILVLLPAILAACDRFIVKKEKI